METFTRLLLPTDAPTVFKLYREIAAHPGGFARASDEVTLAYIEKVLHFEKNGGLGIGAFERQTQEMIGFIASRKPGPKVFDHVLSDLTIGVLPSRQRSGIGRSLFISFLETLEASRPDVLRVELIVRETNVRALSFYESIGFRREGVFEKRIRGANGEFEADIPMGWLKPGI